MRPGCSVPLLTVFLLAALALWLTVPLPRLAGEPHPTLLVLGAAQYNGQPSPVFRVRLNHAARLYAQGGVTRVVVTGGVGDGDRFSEGEVGAAYLRRLGLPEGVVRHEGQSRSTVQNIARALPLLSGPVTLVTDEVHAPRALLLARQAGLTANANAAPLTPRPRYRARERVLLLYEWGRVGARWARERARELVGRLAQ